MTALLERAGAEFARAFLALLLFYSTGILNAPNKDAALALALAALAAAVAGGLRAIQVLIPQISWSGLLTQPIASWADAFTRAFIGVLVSFAVDWLATPDWANWKSAALAAVLAAASAGARALQGLLTPGEQPFKRSGLKPRVT